MISYIHVLLNVSGEPTQAEVDLLNDLMDDWCKKYCLDPYTVEMQVGNSGDDKK